MEFGVRKLSALKALSSPTPDKSRKGGVDEPIVPLITRINAHPSYFTTSSCSGRISISISYTQNCLNRANLTTTKHGLVIAEPQTGAHIKPTKKKKKGGDWSFVSHSYADAEDVIRTVLHACQCPKEQQECLDLMVFRFEPFILAVECRDVDAASTLVSCAISSGFRESGITSARRRIIAAVRCSIRIETPIAKGGQLLVTEDYLRFLVQFANEKMSSNNQRIERFFSAFTNQVEFVMLKEAPNCSNQANLIQKTKSENQVHPSSKRKLKRCDILGRKFLDLERRQVGLLLRLDEVESWTFGPNSGDVFVNESLCGTKEVSSRECKDDTLDAMRELKLPVRDHLAVSNIGCPPAQVDQCTFLPSYIRGSNSFSYTV